MSKAKLLKKRRGSTQLIQTGISIIILLAMAAVVIGILLAIGAQIAASFPSPPPGTLFYNLSRTFTDAINRGAPLLGPLILVGFGVIILASVSYIWAIFGGGRVRGGR